MRRKNLSALAMLFAGAVMLLAHPAGPTSASTPGVTADLDPILQQLETFALERKDAEGVPGMAYAVVRGGQVIYARGFGYKDQTPASGTVDEHTLFEIGSCTKAFNAATLGTVVDEGKVAWSDKVRAQMPDFKMNDPWVTQEFLVEDLMAQRSGMPGYALDMMSLVGFGKADIMRAIRFVDPVTSFRSSFGYQNNLHLWAAALIEKKTGLVWEEAVRQRILAPLGMSESTFDFAAYDANPNHALGHISLSDHSLWTIPPDWPFRGWVATFAPAGGLTSNVTDMAKWVALQLGNGSYGGTAILKPETLQAIRAPRVYTWTTDYGVASYAMGWLFQSSPKTPWYWHDGETMGMHSIVAIYPQLDLGLVVLTNSSGNKVPECMAFRLVELCFGLDHVDCPQQGAAGVLKGQFSCASASAPDTGEAIPVSKLVGTYENPAYGKAVVRREGGVLRIALGPAKRGGVLVPTGGNAYDFVWDNWPGQHTPLTFKADAAGEVHKFTIPSLSDVRGGDFKRVSR